jgi:hypothetical protein
VNCRALGFAFAVSLLTGVLFGPEPAWRTTKADPMIALRSGQANANSSPRPKKKKRLQP